MTVPLLIPIIVRFGRRVALMTLPPPLMALYLTLLALLLTAPGVDAGEVDVLQVASGAGRELQFVVGAATFGAPLPRISASSASSSALPTLPVVRASINGDCTKLLSTEGGVRGAAVLLDRGGSCSFFKSARAAEDAGAALMIVRDTVAGAFESAQRLRGGAIYDCALGETAVDRNVSTSEGYPAVPSASVHTRQCADNRACASNTCVYTGEPAAGGAFQVCCFKNTLVHMVGGSNERKTLSIPAVFVSFRDGQVLDALLRAVKGAVAVRALNAEENPWNPSMLVTWALGVVTVMGAAFYACSDERQWSYRNIAQRIASSAATGDTRDGYVAIDDRYTASVQDAQPVARFEVSMRHVFFFLVGASCMLLLLYYTHLHLVLAVLFALGASAALAQVVTGPLWAAIAPKVEPSLGDYARVLQVLVALVAPAVGLFWFIERAQVWIWPVQDLFCIALCVVCVDVVQLPSLRVATTLLTAAFVYDVFFVYLSPLVFGANVMVDVASGNSLLSLSQQDHHMETEDHSTVPMVLVVPLMFSVYGGSALLGLGDIILPGLLVSFCIRYDYCKGTPLSRGYFSVATIAYAAGLLLANAMAIALRDVVAGQPALMYIVPIMLTSVHGFAKHNDELVEMWNGPPCLDMEASEGHDLGNEGEHEPLLQTASDRV